MTDTNRPHGEGDGSLFMQKVLNISAALAVFGAFILFALFIVVEFSNQGWQTAVFDHFAATVGLPCAAAGAFIICTLFRTAEGKIQFSALGFKFEGASGPIVMWVLCFLAKAAAIRMLWPLKS